MKIKYFGFLLAVFLICSFKQINIQTTDKILKAEEFIHLMDSVGISFQMPSNYTETAVKQNNDLKYLFAIKNDTADFEIRYSIWPLKSAVEEYKKSKSDTSKILVDPNKYYWGIYQSNVLNMTGGAGARVTDFPESLVKTEFNADKGATCFYEFNCGFGKGYKYGQMIILHKENVADVVVTYLSNNKETHPTLMLGPFHNLIFK